MYYCEIKIYAWLPLPPLEGSFGLENRYGLSSSVYKIVLSMGQAESATVKDSTSRKVLESILAEKGRNRAQGHEMRAPEGMSILAALRISPFL